MRVLLLRCCPTKSDRISRIVPTRTADVKDFATFLTACCWNTLTFCRMRGNLSITWEGGASIHGAVDDPTCTEDR